MATLERPCHLAIVSHGDINVCASSSFSTTTDFHSFVVSTSEIKFTKLLRDGMIACVDQGGFLWIWDPKKPYTPSTDKIETTSEYIHYVYQSPTNELCLVHWFHKDKDNTLPVVTVTIVDIGKRTKEQFVYPGGLRHLQHLTGGGLASVCEDRSIYVGNVRTGKGLFDNTISSMVDNMRCNGLVALTYNRLACRFEMTRDIHIYQFVDDEFNEVSCIILPSKSTPQRMAQLTDNELIVSCENLTVCIWNIETQTCTQFVNGNGRIREFYDVCDGKIMFECCHYNPHLITSTIRVWNWTDENERGPMTTETPELGMESVIGLKIEAYPIFESFDIKRCGWLHSGICYLLGTDNHLVIRDQKKRHTRWHASAVYVVHTLADDKWVDKMVATKANLITYFPPELCCIVAMFI